jgi:hypothetical protein
MARHRPELDLFFVLVPSEAVLVIADSYPPAA